MPAITRDEYDVWGHQLLCVATEITTHDEHFLMCSEDRNHWYGYKNGMVTLRDSDGNERKFDTAGEAYRACCAAKAEMNGTAQ